MRDKTGNLLELDHKGVFWYAKKKKKTCPQVKLYMCDKKILTILFTKKSHMIERARWVGRQALQQRHS